MQRHFQFLLFITLLGIILYPASSFAKEELTEAEILQQRMSYYVQFDELLIPWHFLAAIDQYERNLQSVRKDIPTRKGYLAIQFSNEYWSGALNPVKEDTQPETISYFGGMGLDGNNDGIASPQDDEDVIFSMASYLGKFGTTDEDFKLALWEYYGSEEAVNQIFTISTLYRHFKTIELDTHTFPVSIQSNYSYKGTWGLTEAGVDAVSMKEQIFLQTMEPLSYLPHMALLK